jgi:hypothetical protein
VTGVSGHHTSRLHRYFVWNQSSIARFPHRTCEVRYTPDFRRIAALPDGVRALVSSSKAGTRRKSQVPTSNARVVRSDAIRRGNGSKRRVLIKQIVDIQLKLDTVV